MRISSGMIYQAGVNSMQRQTSSLLHTQQQLSTGRRILTPADDPVAAARALEVTQAREINSQYITNQDNAKTSLGLAESQLAAIGDLIQNVQQRAVQAGNTTLTASDRDSIAKEVRARFDELIGIANATDGTGQYLFSGYQGNTKPFSGNVAVGVAYAGDDGQRALQVSASRQLPVSDAGSDIFERIRNGNGTFVTDYASTNTGSGVIDPGNLVSATNWGATANSGNLEIRFWVDNTAATSVTRYDLVNVSPAALAVNPGGTSLFTDGASTTGVGGTYSGTFSSGKAIAFTGLAAPYSDLGASVTVTGQPADGDSFSVKASSSQSLFDTLQNLITTLERPAGNTAGNTALANDIGFALRDLSHAQDNVLRVRASVGSRLSEVNALQNVNADLTLQYAQTLSRLQDVDYAEAISNLTQQQINLEAAQKSYLKVSGLSLFNYI